MCSSDLSPETISTRLHRIATLAREMPGVALRTLAQHIDIGCLREAYRRTRKDGAVGVDRQTAGQYAENLERNLQSLLDRAKSGTYSAPPVRRVHIPKGDGSQVRPIGVPTFEDKILQRAVAMVLEAVYEQDFLACSYGFRPGRSAHQALEVLREGLMTMGGGWVLEVDIRSFLDASSHYPRSRERWLNKSGMASGTLIRKPFLRPRQTWTACSSPRFTRCNTVWRVTPSRRVASIIVTKPWGGASTKRERSSSVMRMRQGAPGVSCSPAMKPSLSQRCTVDGAMPRIVAASATVTKSPVGASIGGSKRGIFQ